MRRSWLQGACRWAIAFLATTLCACASVPDQPGPTQYVDRDDGVNYLVVARPLIFAHVRPQVAARVRDYATVAAAFMDRNGVTSYVLLVYLWSTIDPRNEAGAADPMADLVLAADDRLIPLHPIPDPGQRPPPLDRPPAPHFSAAMYGTDLPTLRYLTSARHLVLLRGHGGGEARFELWDDQRASLADFLRSGQ